MAQVAAHLRNCAVAEVIGYIALLDGHSKIVGPPSIQIAPARSQQAQGERENPFTHAIPCDMLLSGDRLVEFYQSQEARTGLERVFGMGVMAPEDWATRGAFSADPRNQNIVDHALERYRWGGGLVAAFQACGEAAVTKGTWDGSGRRRHTLGSLTNFMEAIYTRTWVPTARSAYTGARSHFAVRFTDRKKAGAPQSKMLELRWEILEAQIETFERDTKIVPEMARNVWKATLAEQWA
jgi:hypothetical protein